DECGAAEFAQDLGGAGGLLGVVVGDADVEGLAGAHGVGERAHGFLEGGVGVGAVVVKDVHVVEAHALERGIERGEQVFARAPFAVGAGGHAVAGFGGDDQLVAVGREVVAEELAEGFFGGAGGRAVVVGEVEVGDAEVEGAAHDGAAGLVGVNAAKVVPEAEREQREVEAGASAAAEVGGGVVAGGGGGGGHGGGSEGVRGQWWWPWVSWTPRGQRESGQRRAPLASSRVSFSL